MLTNEDWLKVRGNLCPQCEDTFSLFIRAETQGSFHVAKCKGCKMEVAFVEGFDCHAGDKLLDLLAA